MYNLHASELTLALLRQFKQKLFKSLLLYYFIINSSRLHNFPPCMLTAKIVVKHIPKKSHPQKQIIRSIYSSSFGKQLISY